MKDYYYFLGISCDASDEDIKKAYRKLSLKYHPDKNENDLFFAKRFHEIQEAYESLSDKKTRQYYDRNLENHQKSFRYHTPPLIKTFTANKIHVRKGEEIVINWQTQNADVVKVLPFGLEKSYGERVFKITEFKDGKFQILLHATNSLLHKTVVQGIMISEVVENDAYKFKHEAEGLFKANKKKIERSAIQLLVIKIIVVILMIIAAICFLLKNNSH